MNNFITEYNEDILLTKLYMSNHICEPERCIRCGGAVTHRMRYCSECSLFVMSKGVTRLIYDLYKPRRNSFNIKLNHFNSDNTLAYTTDEKLYFN